MEPLTNELLHKAIEVDQCILVKLEELKANPSDKALIEEIENDLIRQASLIKRAQRERKDTRDYLTSFLNKGNGRPLRG
jgi:hypothetical protein